MYINQQRLKKKKVTANCANITCKEQRTFPATKFTRQKVKIIRGRTAIKSLYVAALLNRHSRDGRAGLHLSY